MNMWICNKKLKPTIICHEQEYIRTRQSLVNVLSITNVLFNTLMIVHNFWKVSYVVLTFIQIKNTQG